MLTHFGEKGAPRVGYNYRVVIILSLVYTLNFLDRQILSILAEPIKRDIALSDTQLGLLTGFAFAFCYSICGLPVALLADRANRVRIVAIACGVWSLFTAASGLATGFATLAIARVGVGIGEAGCSPPSHSIIADYFQPSRRGRAFAIFLLGAPLGSMLGAIAAATIATYYGWRSAFFVIGILGVLLAPIIVLTVREPQRGLTDPDVRHDTASPRAILAFFRSSPDLVLNMIGCGLTAIVSYGIMNWAPAFLTRNLGMTLPEIATWYGPLLGGSLVVAAWLGAIISDRFGAEHPALYTLLPGLGMVVLVPFLLQFAASADWHHALAMLFVPAALSNTFLVPALSFLHNRTPPALRATASATLLLAINLLGLGLGPLIVGSISDLLTPAYGERALGYALMWLTPFALAAFGFQAAAAMLNRRRRAS